MKKPQSRIKSAADVVAPVKARTCHAAVSRGKPATGPRLMQRGAERC